MTFGFVGDPGSVLCRRERDSRRQEQALTARLTALSGALGQHRPGLRHPPGQSAQPGQAKTRNGQRGNSDPGHSSPPAVLAHSTQLGRNPYRNTAALRAKLEEPLAELVAEQGEAEDEELERRLASVPPLTPRARGTRFEQRAAFRRLVPGGESMGSISRWFPPFTGVIFVALFVAIMILIGEGQDATDKTAQEIATYYQDNDTKEFVASILIGFAAVFILFFGSWLRKFLRDAEGPDGILPSVVLLAAGVFSAGAAVGGSIHLALTDLADDIDPVALQAINGIDYDLFMFFPVGLGTLILATGISAVRHGSLPKWLAWVSIVIGVLFFTPVAFWFVFFLAPLWILIVSILGMRASGGESASVTT